MKKQSTLAAELRPEWLRDIDARIAALTGRTPTNNASGSATVAQHALSDTTVHSGQLSPSQAPWAAASSVSIVAGAGLTGGGTLANDVTVNVGAGTLITVGADDIGISDGSAYQFVGTGGDTTAGWVNLSTLAGSGLTHNAGVLSVGAGDGVTVGADAVAVASTIAGDGLTWSSGSTSYETIAQRGTATTGTATGTPAGYQTITQRGTATTGAGAGSGASYDTIAQRGSATSGNSYTNSLSVTRPTGVVENDVLIAVVTWWANTLTPPSGWTQIGTTQSWSHPDGTVYARAYYRVAGASEPSSYAWGLSATNDIACTIVAYSNVDTTDPISASGAQTQTSASMTAPSVDAATTTDMLVFLGAAGDNDAGSRTATPPSGMTELADATNGTSWIKAYAAQQLLTASGATGTRTATISASARNAGFLVALRPSATAGSNTSVTVNKPTGVVNDDVMLAIASYSGGTLTAPAGWTVATSVAYTGGYMAVYYRVASSEGASYTWELNNTSALAVAIVAYDNCDTADPIDAANSQENVSGTSMTAPTVTASTNANMLVFLGSILGNIRATAPSGMTEDADTGTTGIGVYVADQLLAASGATGTKTATLASAAVSAAALVALTPASTSLVATTTTVTKPTGVTNGDVMLAAVSYSGGALTVPSGWTQVISQAYTGGTLRVYSRVASSEGANYTWALNTADSLSVAIIAYDNADTSSPLEAFDSQGNSASTSMVAPSVSTSVATDVLLFVGACVGNVRATSPAGMNEEADTGASGASVYLADQTLSGAGATGGKTATLASSATNAAALLALKPALASSSGGGVLNVGAGAGLTVGADTISLTTPGTLSVSTSNSAAGNHVHAITSSSAPGAAASILASDASGNLQLVSLTATAGVTTPVLASATSIALQPAGASVTLALNKDFSSATYASGFAGSGWRLDHGITNASRSFMEIDDLSVRGRLRVFELLIQQIRATNGSVFVSSTGKVRTVTADVNPAWTVNGVALTFNGDAAVFTTTLYTITTGDATEDADSKTLYHGFTVGDAIRAQRTQWNGTSFAGVYQSNLTVTAVTDLYTFKAAKDSGDAPQVGYEYVRLGNLSDTTRQGSIYITADDSGAPFIDIIDGVRGHSDWNTTNVRCTRIGRLSGITDADFGGALSGYGLYANRAYIKGTIVVTGGNALKAGDAARDINTNTTTIDGGRITANSVTATQIDVDTLSALTINTGALTVSDVLSIGEDGGIYQGTGTFGTPTTGLKVWRDSGIGRIGGYNGGTLQWYANTDGKFYAGGGSTYLDATGVHVVSSASTPPIDNASYMLTRVNGSTVMGRLAGYDNGSTERRVILQATSDAVTKLYLSAASTSNSSATTVEMWAATNLYTVSTILSAVDGTITMDAPTVAATNALTVGTIATVGGVRVDDDLGGAASTVSLSNVSNVAANSTGTGTIKFKSATNRNSSGFIKIYIGTTAYYVPVFSAIT